MGLTSVNGLKWNTAEMRIGLICNWLIVILIVVCFLIFVMLIINYFKAREESVNTMKLLQKYVRGQNTTECKPDRKHQKLLEDLNDEEIVVHNKNQ